MASALTEHYPASIEELGNIIKVVLITGGTKEEAIERAKKSMVGMEVDPRKVLLWCEHIAEQYGRRNWHYLQVTSPILLCDCNDDFMLSRLYMHVAKVIRYGTPLTYILIGWFLLQESLRVSRESRDELNTITTVGVPQSIIDNMTVISDEDGAAALRVTEKFTRRAYMPRSGQQEDDEEEEDEVEADEDEEDILGAYANDDQEHVDPLEYSLCHEEPNVSQADRLQYAAMKQLETIARKEQDPEDMGIVERNDLAYQRGEGDNMDDEDEENLERGRKLVLTFDGNHPVRSFDPEWFMLNLPDHFPNGTGGPPEGVSKARWIRYLMGIDDTLFQMAYFICMAGDDFLRSGVNLASHLAFKTSPGRFKTASNATNEHVKRVAAIIARRGRPKAEDAEEVKALHSQVESS